MYVEYDTAMSHLFQLAIEKDAHGLFDAILELPPKDPKLPFAIDLLEEITGLSFAALK